jgi:hypothetical protein
MILLRFVTFNDGVLYTTSYGIISTTVLDTGIESPLINQNQDHSSVGFYHWFI